MLFLLLGLVVGLGAGSPPPPYGFSPRPQPYLPAPPGKTPPCIKYGQTYCENVDHYPAHLIQYLVERWVYDYNTLFTDDRRNIYKPRPHYGSAHFQHQKHFPMVPNNSNNQQYPSLPTKHFPLKLIRYARSERKKRQISETNLCPTTSRFVMPKVALNTAGDYKYIVNINSNQRYTQVIEATTCVSNECNGICSLPLGYTSSCVQQYVRHRLVALDGGGDRLYTDSFWLPHCCNCQITRSVR